MENEINTPPALNSISKTDISNFYEIFINMKESKKLFNSFKKYIKDSCEAITGYYKQMTEINGRFLVDYDFKSSITKSPIFKLGKVLKNLLQTHIDNLFTIISDDNIFDACNNSLTLFSKILQESTQKFDKKNIEKDLEPIAKSLNEKYGEIESTIVDDYIYKKYNKHIEGINNDSLENSLVQAQFLEKTFLDLEEVNKFQYFSNLKEMENKTVNVYNEMKKIVENFMVTLDNIRKKYLKILEEEKKEIKTLTLDNDENDNFEEEEKKTTESIEFKNIIDNDIFKYKIKIVKKPNIRIEDETDKKTKDKKNKNKENNKNNNNDNKGQDDDTIYDNELVLTEEDIYNIVSTIYSYNLKLISKSEYNLDLKKEILEIINLTGKLLSYDIEKKINENITEEEVNKLYQMLQKEENMMKFFLLLNNYRVTGRCNMTERAFKILEKIFIICQDYLLKTKNSDLEGLIIILSQTFYIIKNENKIYLQQLIREHNLFKKEDFWKDHLNDCIQEELNKIENGEKEGRFVFPKEIKEKKIKEIITAKLIPFSNNMIEFGASKDKILDIINPIMDKYNLDENSRLMTLSVLELK